VDTSDRHPRPRCWRAIDLENRTQILASQTADMAEALSAFLQKRPPNFENR